MRGKCTGLKHDTEAMASVLFVHLGRGAFCYRLKHDRQGHVDEAEVRMPA